MRIFIFTLLVLLVGGAWFGVRHVQRSQIAQQERLEREIMLRQREPAVRQKLEEAKQEVSFQVLEPVMPPAGFYLSEFFPMGAFIEKNILTFDYQSADGIVLSVYERPLRDEETISRPSTDEWQSIVDVQLKGESPAYFMEREETSGGMLPSGQKIAVAIKNNRLRFGAGGLLVELTGTNAAGGSPERILSREALMGIANSFITQTAH